MKRDRRRPSPKPRTSPNALERLHPDAAGIDCGSAEHFVAVPPDRDPTAVRSFPTFTADLYCLADWLTACRVTHVTMEATGVYWIPIYQRIRRRSARRNRGQHVRRPLRFRVRLPDNSGATTEPRTGNLGRLLAYPAVEWRQLDRRYYFEIRLPSQPAMCSRPFPVDLSTFPSC